MTRCPTCDMEMVSDDDPRADTDDDVCVRSKPYCKSAYPVDWRTRALKAEGEVERMRAIVEAAVEWRTERQRLDAEAAELNARLRRGETVTMISGRPSPEAPLARAIDAALAAEEKAK